MTSALTYGPDHCSDRVTWRPVIWSLEVVLDRIQVCRNNCLKVSNCRNWENLWLPRSQLLGVLWILSVSVYLSYQAVFTRLFLPGFFYHVFTFLPGWLESVHEWPSAGKSVCGRSLGLVWPIAGRWSDGILGLGTNNTKVSGAAHDSLGHVCQGHQRRRTGFRGTYHTNTFLIRNILVHHRIPFHSLDHFSIRYGQKHSRFEDACRDRRSCIFSLINNE